MIGRHGKGLDKLQYISGADIYIDKNDENQLNGNDKEVNVEIIGTKIQKSKALKLMQNWGTGTMKLRFEKFKLRITDIPNDKNDKNAEIWVKQILSPYCNIYCSRFSLIVFSSSQCVAISIGDSEKINSRAFSLSTSILPVDEPINIFTPQTLDILTFFISSILSFDAPR